MNRFLTVVNATSRVVQNCRAARFLLHGHDYHGGFAAANEERKNYMYSSRPPINYPKMSSIVMRTVVVLINGTMTQDVRESQASYTCELAKAAVTRWSGTRARMSNVFKIIAPFPKRGAIHVTCHETVKIPRHHRAPFY